MNSEVIASTATFDSLCHNGQPNIHNLGAPKLQDKNLLVTKDAGMQ